MFHGNLVHGSAGNITPYPREIVYLTLCAVSNHIRTPTRPEWIAHRDFTPIEPVADDALARFAAAIAGGRMPMNLHRLLEKRRAAGKPVRVGLIGAGKFGSMFLSQVPHYAGTGGGGHRRPRSGPGAPGVPDRRLGRGADRAPRASPIRRIGARPAAASKWWSRRPAIPLAGIEHARAAIAAGKHIVMVNVEADVLAGPLLARRGRGSAGVVYSLAYGDQPALIAELVDWARACGFRGGRGRQGHQVPAGLPPVTPARVWSHYGLTAERGAVAPA